MWHLSGLVNLLLLPLSFLLWKLADGFHCGELCPLCIPIQWPVRWWRVRLSLWRRLPSERLLQTLGLGGGKLPAVQVQLVCEAFKWLQSEQRYVFVFWNMFFSLFSPDEVTLIRTKPSKSVSKSLALWKGQPKKKATGMDFEISLKYVYWVTKIAEASSSLGSSSSSSSSLLVEKQKKRKGIILVLSKYLKFIYIYFLQIMLFRKDLLHPHQWKGRFCKGNEKVLS